MRNLRLIFGILVVIALTAGQGEAQHYYGGGNAIPLKVDSTKVTIKFDVGFGSNSQATLLAAIDRIVGVVTDDHVIDDFIVCTLSTAR